MAKKPAPAKKTKAPAKKAAAKKPVAKKATGKRKIGLHPLPDLKTITGLGAKRLYTEAKNAYYNTAHPILTDADFDKLEAWLRAKFPKWEGHQKVGAPIAKDASRKAKLPHAMASLDKVKPDGSAAKWLGTKPGKATISAKGDGVSCQLKMIGGKVRAYTRGDGETGTDITNLMPHIKGMAGKLKEGQAIRGEIMMENKVFDKKYAAKFANSRNLVSGVINAKKPDLEVAKDCVFVVHSQIHPDIPLHKAAAALTKAGFKMIDHKVVDLTGADEAKLIATLKAVRKTSPYELDGIVIQKHSNEDTKAFKANADGEAATVKHIEWQTPSRHGVIKPVIILDKPVKLSGAMVTRVTGNNARFIHDQKIGPGAKLTVVRSGDTIPKVESVVKGSEPNLPDTAHEWNTGKTDYVVKKGAADKGQAASMSARQLENFLVKAGVEGVKSTMLEKITKMGINTVDKLIKASPVTLKAAGFGPKQVAALQSQLATKTKSMSQADLMAGSGIFPQGWGTRMFKTVLADIPMEKLRTMPKSELLTAVSAIHGMGSKRAVEFATKFHEYLAFEKQTGLAAKAKTAGSAKLAGKVFTVSGFRDKGLGARIEDAGGQYSDSLTKKTTHVIFRTAAQQSGTKFDKAKKLGLQCITLDQLNKMFGKG